MDLDFGRIAETVMRVLRETGAEREPAVCFAVREAIRQLIACETARGLASLDYAQRLAPSDGGISFAVGLVRLALGEKRATEPLELLAKRTGWREVLLYLAIARRRFGDRDNAAADLHRLLRANAPEPGASFAALAGAVAAESGSLGWCGLDNAGRVSLGGAAASLAAGELEIRLDDRPIRAPKGRVASPEGVRQFALPEGWAAARRLTVLGQGRPLIGSPIELAQVTRMEGFVATTEAGGISGWCWLPGETEFVPEIVLCSAVSPEPPLRLRAEQLIEAPKGFAEFAAPRRFEASPAQLAAFDGALEVRGPHGRTLYGSPVRPHAALDSARQAAIAVAGLYPADGRTSCALGPGREPSIPACLSVTRPIVAGPACTSAGSRGVDVIIPVYRGLAVTMACLDSVLAARAEGTGPPDERIVVVVDASPEAELVARLQALADTGAILLSNQTTNRGFPATANIGLRIAAAQEGAPRDAVLLNSDTLAPPGWLTRLRDAVHSAPDIGTATPLSNDATIFSYPQTDAANPAPDLAQVVSTAAFAHAANAGEVVDVPTGHGFCMYIRAECLAETGALREDVFAQGYGEENDFSMRARVFGWRHVAVPGAFVGHVGSQSFAATRTHLIERNLATLNRLHVGYDRLVMQWLAADPLAASRRRIDRLRFEADTAGRRAVLLVTHNRGGGVLRHVRERAVLHEAAGERALLLRPGRDADGGLFCTIEHEAGEPTPNLRFSLPKEIDSLRALLQRARVRLIELHHFIGHDETLLLLVREFGCPYDLYVHDYAWFCPRVTLTNGSNRYCGEPPISACVACVADHGNNIDEAIAPAALRARSAELLAGARTVVAPSWDTARRIEQQFGVDVSVGVWERATSLRPGRPSLRNLVRSGERPQARRRVCVVGAVGPEKGYETLLYAARHAAERDLPLEFALVGYSCDDRRLLETGRVSITGRYAEAEAVRLIRAQGADFAFLPALWPETWSYVLSQIWEAGLAVVAHDIGAPAERIAAGGGGVVLPLHMPAAKLAELFVGEELFAGMGKKAAGLPVPAVAGAAPRAVSGPGEAVRMPALFQMPRGGGALPAGIVWAVDATTERFIVPLAS